MRMSYPLRRLEWLPWLALAVVLAASAGCSPAGEPASLAVGPVTLKPADADIERWVCGDIIDGCWPLNRDCVHLTGNLNAGTGIVSFGDGIAAATQFHIDGIERRWNWCLEDGAYKCAFVVSPGGDGRYFQFRGMPGGRAKPTSLWSCSKSLFP